MKDTLHTRGQAMEDSFFRSVDQALVELMKEQNECEKARRKLSDSTGIEDKGLLDEMMESGINPATIIAFLLLPLVKVAWADRRVEEKERTVVINTAAAFGYTDESAGMRLLKSWLQTPPDEKLFSIWREYAPELVSHLKLASGDHLRRTIVKRAKTVAEATGGFLGIHKTAAAEQTVINQIEEALSR